jgi:hypothetical protein
MRSIGVSLMSTGSTLGCKAMIRMATPALRPPPPARLVWIDHRGEACPQIIEQTQRNPHSVQQFE